MAARDERVERVERGGQRFGSALTYSWRGDEMDLVTWGYFG